MALRLHHLSKRFGGVHVLRNVCIEFHPGTVTAIVGDNGAGKSTLLKSISGIYRPEEGQIFIEGHDISQLSIIERRKAGIEMVYQNLALAPSHDAFTNLFVGRELLGRFGSLSRRKMKEEGVRWLNELGIQIPNPFKPVRFLSGGQQQAIAVARALLFDPKVLLLDEPTAALAAREIERILNFIRKEREKGRTIVIVSHRLQDLFEVADRIVVMRQGEILADDPIAGTTLEETVRRIVGSEERSG